MSLQQGQILNSRYRIAKQIGQGGFGSVYRAWDLRMEAACVIKENLEFTQEATHQFIREAQILFKLKHPGMPVVYDYFDLPGQGLYLVMEYVEGQNLCEIVTVRGFVPEKEALNWIIQVCEALEYLHDQNPPIIHRDIKPQNIIITPKNRAILVDFGVAKVFQPNQKTTIGARAATPGYSPPEQYMQIGTDARSDIYSLGATLYTLLTGQVPPESVARSLDEEVVDIHIYNSLVSKPVVDAVETAMAYKRQDRFASAQKFREALSGKAFQSNNSPLPVSPTQFSTQQHVDAHSNLLMHSSLKAQQTAGTIRANSPPAKSSVFNKKLKKWLIPMAGSIVFLIGIIVVFGIIMSSTRKNQSKESIIQPGITSTLVDTIEPVKTETKLVELVPTLVPTEVITLGTAENPLILAFPMWLTSQQFTERGDLLVEALMDKTGYVIVSSLPSTNISLIEGIGSGTVHIAYIASVPYIIANDKGYAKVGLIGERLGTTSYGFQFIAARSSGFKSFFDSAVNRNTADVKTALAQFAGKKPCFVDPRSVTGYIMPYGFLRSLEIPINSEVFVQSHPAVVTSLYAGNICDFGATYIDARSNTTIETDFPDVMEEIDVIWQSEPFIPNDVISFSSKMPPWMVQDIKQAFLEISSTDAGKAMLAELYGFEVFKEVDDSIFEDFRLYMEASGIDYTSLIK